MAADDIWNRTMEKELTRADLNNGISIPPDWPMNVLPFCGKGKTVLIRLRDGVIADKSWVFKIRRYEESDPGTSPYKFLVSNDWRKFAAAKGLRVRDKIVIQTERRIDLNTVIGYRMMYTIRAQRKGPDLLWADIPPRRARI